MTSRHLILSATALAAASAVSGAIHRLFVGNLFLPAAIYSLEYDDVTDNITLVRNHTADASHAWITFDHAKTNIYATSLNASRISSYRVTDPSTIELANSINASGACLKTTSAFITASSTYPYYAFSGSWPSPRACGMSFAVDGNGTLTEVVESWSYDAKSGIHGLALSAPNVTATTSSVSNNKKSNNSSNQLLYSADLSADLLWTHAINPVTGHVHPVSHLQVSPSGSHPRHLAVHPQGGYLYAVMEAGNAIAQFTLDSATGIPLRETRRDSLIPDGANPSDYWSAEVMLSASAHYLWATARAKHDNATGYVSVFILDETDGHILRRICQVPTTTTGGSANAISPAPWSDQYAAMTDYPKGYVQIWQLQRSKKGGDYETAAPVARVDVGDGGCCANVIWYD